MNQTDLEAYQRQVLGHEGVGFTEYRNINGGRFVGINPRKTKDGTTNQDVIKITCIVIDIDMHGESNVDPVAIAKSIVLLESYQSYVIVSSGRGAHIYLPVDLPLGSNVKGYLANLNSIYGGNCTIDSIGDSARVIRCWGSKNEKNGAECHIIEDHFNGKNQIKLPEVTKQVLHSSYSLGTIPNGSRNNSLTSLAGSMRSKGMSVEAITSALLEENKIRCNPPLHDNEVKAIASSVSRYAPKPITSENKSFSNFHEKYLSELMNRQIGYSTGFAKLDNMLAGLQKGRLYVLVARTNEGKTTFSCNLVNKLLTQNVSILYFPTELGYAPLFDKIIAQRSEIPLKAFQFGNFTEKQKESIKFEINNLQSTNFSIHEDFGLTFETVVKRTKEASPQVVIIDFINAMKYNEGGTPQEIAANVRGIKELASDLNIPIILNAQFNRGAIQNEISLQYIKGSGAIEEFADVVMALQTVNKMEYPRTVDLHILKNRYSEIGKIRFQFYSTTGTFKEV